MRKTWRLVAAGMMAAALMTGCGGNAGTAETTTGAEATTTVAGDETTTEESTEFVIQDYSEYVTLGEYKGIPVSPINVTDEEIDERIARYFHNVVEEGDTVNIDFTGYLNGEVFEGGSAEGQSLTIGSGQFIDGFESGLVGVAVGETVDLDVTFPENYQEPTLAGQPVVFTVTVNSITNAIASEYTLENVTANTACTTLEEYESTIYDEIYAEYNEARMSELWQTVLENTTVNSYPQEEVDASASEMESYYTQMASYYGMEFETFLSNYGYTPETFQADCQAYGQSVAEETMVLNTIAFQENMEVTDEEYRAEIDKAMEQSGMDEASILEYYGGEGYIRESLLFSKVIDFLTAQAVEQ